ncbi:sugar ABC transporter substrate-binding protein [Pullulanibacillus camelliae]|uniref:Sugar ABC transporter substrate-binding protein n=1 Tax=Pullulanibacillus camelliae TaxID=1707096 RepID=A0A8J2VLT7_9BACL|nr:extracellular solute-binding protein [Pullulanibacillus camelliae]GGE30910.1 sugar ABC transporter substrate-binding protein [Pullulanibacillus camelliae]
MKKRLISMFLVMGLLVLSLTACGGDSEGSSKGKTTITYWQYTFPEKVTEIKALIKKFEAENPNIKVVAQDFPYDQYNQKIAAAMNAKKGPDIMNLFYGWLPQYQKNGYIQAIPEDFMSTKAIDQFYNPMIQSSKIDGKYYGLPTAVRSLALFWNKDLFKAAGLDPEKPPKTWDQLVEMAKKMTKIKANGQYEQEGFAWNVDGQDYHTFEEVLLRQWGVQPFSHDGKKVLWNSSPEGLKAFEYWVNMTKKDKIGDGKFLQGYNTAFKAGKAAMMIDGSFSIAATKEAAKFDWGVTTLPVREEGGTESNYGSYWTNSIAKGVSGAKLKASEKFLKFLISEDTEKEWMDKVGELPASAALGNDPSIIKDPIYGPFVRGLKNAHATMFVDEAKERTAIANAVDKILLKNAPIDQTFEELVKEQQRIRDDYYK